MEITAHDGLTVLHGMGFGAFLLLSFSGAAVGLYVLAFSSRPWASTDRELRFFVLYLAAMALLAWLTVCAGAYIVYPLYRLHVPLGTVDLSGYPQKLLMSNPATSGWHDLGMEWKEHIAWFAPMALTAIVAIVGRYGRELRDIKGLRGAVVGLMLLGFFATAVAGFFGAMLNKFAPVRGGATIVIMTGENHE